MIGSHLETAVCPNSVSWLYRLENSYSWPSGFEIDEDLVFYDRTGFVRMIFERDGTITVTRGYAWNGASPKFCLLDILIGTPDGVVDSRTGRPKTYFATLIHDALYQFLPDGAPVGRRDADRFFFQLMQESGFRPRWIYWGAVRLAGGAVRWLTRHKRQTLGTRRTLS